MNVGYFTAGLMVGASLFGAIIKHGEETQGGGWVALLLVTLFALCILIITELSKDGR